MMPKDFTSEVDFPIASYMGQVLYPFGAWGRASATSRRPAPNPTRPQRSSNTGRRALAGISFLFPLFVLAIVKDKEERILVMMKMVRPSGRPGFGALRRTIACANNPGGMPARDVAARPRRMAWPPACTGWPSTSTFTSCTSSRRSCSSPPAGSSGSSSLPSPTRLYDAAADRAGVGAAGGPMLTCRCDAFIARSCPAPGLRRPVLPVGPRANCAGLFHQCVLQQVPQRPLYGQRPDGLGAGSVRSLTAAPCAVQRGSVPVPQ